MKIDRGSAAAAEHDLGRVDAHVGQAEMLRNMGQLAASVHVEHSKKSSADLNHLAHTAMQMLEHESERHSAAEAEAKASEKRNHAMQQEAEGTAAMRSADGLAEARVITAKAEAKKIDAEAEEAQGLAEATVFVGAMPWEGQGNTGTIWIDDISVRETGLVNLIRRDDAPLVARRVGQEALVEALRAQMETS